VLGPGQYNIVATYSGDPNDNGSVSAPPYVLTVNLATTLTVVSSNPNPSQVLGPVTFTAVVSGNGGTPTGPVTFLADGVAMGPAVNVDGTGTATFVYAGLTVGSHQITASYAGDTNDSPSVSTAITQVVNVIPTVTFLGSSTTTGSNPQVILVASVLNNSSASSLPMPTGTVTFNNGATVLGSSPLDAGGVATLVPNLTPGTYTVTAYYSGDLEHGTSTSPPIQITVPATGFELAVNPDNVTLAATQNTTITVTLTSDAGFADTIGLGCASLPAGVTCHFSNDEVDLTANETPPPAIQLTIDTNYPLTGGASTAMNSHTTNRGAYLAGLFLPFSLFFGWVLWRFRRRHATVLITVLVLLLSSAVMLITGCSGLGSSAAVPGTYVIQVVGVGENSDVTHYQNVTLVITQ
jgi:hypothetical protein